MSWCWLTCWYVNYHPQQLPCVLIEDLKDLREGVLTIDNGDVQHLWNKESWSECGDITKGKVTTTRCRTVFAIALTPGILSSFWMVQLSSIHLMFYDLGFTGLWHAQCTRLPLSMSLLCISKPRQSTCCFQLSWICFAFSRAATSRSFRTSHTCVCVCPCGCVCVCVHMCMHVYMGGSKKGVITS